MTKANKPATAKAMTLRRSKTGIIFSQAIGERMNISPDWSVFAIRVVEVGLFLELVETRNDRFRYGFRPKIGSYSYQIEPDAATQFSAFSPAPMGSAVTITV